MLGRDGLTALSRLVIEITLPAMIFCNLLKDFSFQLYPDWWIFPVMSVAIILVGFLIGCLFIGFFPGSQKKLQFISLIAFQNSGYLPLALFAALLPPATRNTIFIYLFLFLLGFNLLMWSFGAYLLTFTRAKKFELATLFSPPVIATLVSLLIVYFGWQRFVPRMITQPLEMVGECTLPLAMFVVGGGLAQIKFLHVDIKAMSLMVLAKLVILPLIGYWFILRYNLPELMGLLLLVQLAAPPATSLSVITTHYKKDDLLISQGIFFGHIISIITIPLFLSIYFSRVMIK